MKKRFIIIILVLILAISFSIYYFYLIPSSSTISIKELKQKAINLEEGNYTVAAFVISIYDPLSETVTPLEGTPRPPGIVISDFSTASSVLRDEDLDLSGISFDVNNFEIGKRYKFQFRIYKPLPRGVTPPGNMLLIGYS